MADLKTDVRYIKGIGEQRAKALGKLGIHTLRDLISWFPRRYEDRTETRRIADLVPGEPACVAAMVAAPPTVSHIRKGLDLVKVRAVDETGALDVTFFNQSWLKTASRRGRPTSSMAGRRGTCSAAGWRIPWWSRRDGGRPRAALSPSTPSPPESAR